MNEGNDLDRSPRIVAEGFVRDLPARDILASERRTPIVIAVDRFPIAAVIPVRSSCRGVGRRSLKLALVEVDDVAALPGSYFRVSQGST